MTDVRVEMAAPREGKQFTLTTPHGDKFAIRLIIRVKNASSK
jgi:hypothetical protein